MADFVLLNFANDRKDKEYRRVEEIIERFTDEELRKRYRFGRAEIHAIVNALQRQGFVQEYPTKRGLHVSPTEQVLVVLRFYATGAFMQVVGDTFGLAKSTVSLIISRVTDGLVTLLPAIIIWPNTPGRRQEIMAGFHDLAGFPSVVGCIDCTHVKIQRPSPTYEADFVTDYIICAIMHDVYSPVLWPTTCTDCITLCVTHVPKASRIDTRNMHMHDMQKYRSIFVTRLCIEIAWSTFAT